MTKKRSSEFSGVKMEIFFQKKMSFGNFGPRKSFPPPPTRRQVSATAPLPPPPPSLPPCLPPLLTPSLLLSSLPPLPSPPLAPYLPPPPLPPNLPLPPGHALTCDDAQNVQ